MESIVIKSHYVTRYEDSINYDKIGTLTTTIEEGSIQDFSNIFIVNYEQGYTQICGEILDLMIKEGLTKQENEKIMIGYYAIKIYFSNGSSKDLIFFEDSLAKEALDSICSITFMKKFKLAFKDNGFFLNCNFNPYEKEPDNEDYMRVWNSLFDENGNVLQSITDMDFVDFMDKKKCHPLSQIVQLYYGHIQSINTNGEFPAINIWKTL